MLERYPLSRNEIIIARYASDHELWKTFIAIHFSAKYFREENISNDRQLEVCMNLIRKGIANDNMLAMILLYQVVDHTKATYRQIAKEFGHELSERIRDSSITFNNFEDFESYYKDEIGKAGTSIVPRIIEERIELDRNGNFLERFAIEKGYWKTLLALHYANKHLANIIRRDGNMEITHSTNGACALIDRNLPTENPDYRLAKFLLHDVCENGNITNDNTMLIGDVRISSLEEKELTEPEKMELKKIIYFIRQIKTIFNKEIADDVDRMTKRPIPEKYKNDKRYVERYLLNYYQGILESVDASVIKAIDQEEIVSSMIISFSIKRLKRKLDEMRFRIIPFMKEARNKPEFVLSKGVFFSCRRHIKSVIASIERYIRVVEFTIGIFTDFKNIQREFCEFEEMVRSLVEKSPNEVDLKSRLEGIKLRLSGIADKNSEFQNMIGGK